MINISNRGKVWGGRGGEGVVRVNFLLNAYVGVLPKSSFF